MCHVVYAALEFLLPVLPACCSKLPCLAYSNFYITNFSLVHSSPHFPRQVEEVSGSSSECAPEFGANSFLSGRPHGVRAYFKAVKMKGMKNTRNESELSRHKKHTSEHAASQSPVYSTLTPERNRPFTDLQGQRTSSFPFSFYFQVSGLYPLRGSRDGMGRVGGKNRQT